MAYKDTEGRGPVGPSGHAGHTGASGAAGSASRGPGGGGGGDKGRSGPRNAGGVTGATKSRTEAQSAAKALHDAMEKNPRAQNNTGSWIGRILGALAGTVVAPGFGTVAGWKGGKYLGGLFDDAPLTGQERQVDAMTGGGGGGSWGSGGPGNAPGGQGGGAGNWRDNFQMMGPKAGGPAGITQPGGAAAAQQATQSAATTPPAGSGMVPDWNHYGEQSNPGGEYKFFPPSSQIMMDLAREIANKKASGQGSPRPLSPANPQFAPFR